MASSSTRRPQGDSTHSSNVSDGPAERRVDLAHAMANQPLPLAEPSATDVPHPPEALQALSQMRVQAGQLASHLKEIRDDLDRRESELNARSAELDTQLRGARMWAEERDFELAEKARLLDERAQQLADYAAKNAANNNGPAPTPKQQKNSPEDVGLATRLREIAQREEAQAAETERLARQEEAIRHTLGLVRQERESQQAELEQRQRELELQAERVEQQQSQSARAVEAQQAELHQATVSRATAEQNEVEAHFQRQCEQAAVEFAAREQFLEDSEVLLAESQAAVDKDRELLTNERQQFEAKMNEAEQRVKDRQMELEGEWNVREEALSRRQEQLDAREAAVSQLRTDVASMHRESLEMRLATEELWSSLLDDAPQAQLTHQLSQIRAKLSDHYRLAETEIDSKREEMEALCERLAQQRDRLSREKVHFKQWLASCESEIEQQAGELASRESLLNEQESALTGHFDEWEEERRAYQHEIRRLLAALRGERLLDTESAAA